VFFLHHSDNLERVLRFLQFNEVKQGFWIIYSRVFTSKSLSHIRYVWLGTGNLCSTLSNALITCTMEYQKDIRYLFLFCPPQESNQAINDLMFCKPPSSHLV